MISSKTLEDALLLEVGQSRRLSSCTMNCKQPTNATKCNCTYEPCSRKGMCCDCLRYHLSSRELPACCFSAAAEATFDRSFEHFARLVTNRKI